MTDFVIVNDWEIENEAAAYTFPTKKYYRIVVEFGIEVDWGAPGQDQIQVTAGEVSQTFFVTRI